MSDAKFIQLHTLTSYPGTLLNRDDAGFAKRLPFGGVTRTRVSSQCLKYHWRNFEGENSLSGMDIPHAVRSRETFKRLVAKPLIDEGQPERLVGSVLMTLVGMLLADKKPDQKKHTDFLNGENDLESVVETSQITIFGEPEVEYIKNLTREKVEEISSELNITSSLPDELSKDQIKTIYKVCKEIPKGDLKKNLKGLKSASGLEAAMFGRMATSDVLARGDAAVHVAHSFTVHAEGSESDYFTAVDELKMVSGEGELGSGHINSTELTSGLFYGYAVIDVPLLISNLEGCPSEEWEKADRTLAAEVVKRFVRLISTVSPGAKLGSTAPYSYAECVIAETGQGQPRTLANAFRKPVEEQPDVLENAYNALSEHLKDLDSMYGKKTDRQVSGTGPVSELTDVLGIDKPVPIEMTAQWISDKVRS